MVHTLFIMPNTEKLQSKLAEKGDIRGSAVEACEWCDGDGDAVHNRKRMNGFQEIAKMMYPSFEFPIPIELGCFSVWNIWRASYVVASSVKYPSLCGGKKEL